MTTSSAGRVYAEVLVDVANGQSGQISLDAALAQMDRVIEATGANPVLKRLFSNPTLTAVEQGKVVESLTKTYQLDGIVDRFFRILIRRRRMALLSEIVEAARDLSARQSGALLGQVESPAPLAKEEVLELAKTLQTRLGKRVVLKERVVPSLIAGVRVSVEGKTIDGSVRGKLSRAREQFVSQI
jgi:F-type H+-transporting ATPase subunit delta